MTGSSKEWLLEIYKLHAELADRVSQRREGASSARQLVIRLSCVPCCPVAVWLRGDNHTCAFVIFRIHRHGHIRILIYCDSFLPATQYRKICRPC